MTNAENVTEKFKSEPICQHCGSTVQVFAHDKVLSSNCDNCQTLQEVDTRDADDLEARIYKTFGANFSFGRSSAPLAVSKKPMKIFISGPMTGYPDYNFPAFDKVEQLLNSKGIKTVSPVTICQEYSQEAVIKDKTLFAKMVEKQQDAEKTCTAILLLKGWEASNGARLELNTALKNCLDIFQESDIPLIIKKARNPNMKLAMTIAEVADEDWKTQLARKYPNIPAGTRVAVLQEDYYNWYGGPWTRVEWNNNLYWTKPENLHVDN